MLAARGLLHAYYEEVRQKGSSAYEQDCEGQRTAQDFTSGGFKLMVERWSGPS